MTVEEKKKKKILTLIFATGHSFLCISSAIFVGSYDRVECKRMCGDFVVVVVFLYFVCVFFLIVLELFAKTSLVKNICHGFTHTSKLSLFNCCQDNRGVCGAVLILTPLLPLLSFRLDYFQSLQDYVCAKKKKNLHYNFRIFFYFLFTALHSR